MSRPNKEVFYKETLGPPFGEKEHWFSFIFPDGDGPIFVEHEWSHHNPYNLERAVSGSGTAQMSGIAPAFVEICLAGLTG